MADSEVPRSAVSSERARSTLEPLGVHSDWARAFHDPSADRFYDLQFDRFASYFKHAPDGPVLDVGCGPGFHAVRLVRRGFQVTALDFSPSALREAERLLAAERRDPPSSVVQGDLLDLPFSDGEFSRVLCYGVLMHVPDLRRAIDELARVVAPGGTLIVSEGNMHSVDDFAHATVRRLKGRGGEQRRLPSGLELVAETPSGPLLVRHANVPWLIGEFEARGLQLVRRTPGQFTEIHVRFPPQSLPARAIRGFNRLWMGLGIAAGAFGTILVLRRPG